MFREHFILTLFIIFCSFHFKVVSLEFGIRHSLSSWKIVVEANNPQIGDEFLKMDVFQPSGFRVSLAVKSDVRFVTFVGSFRRLTDKLYIEEIGPWTAIDVRPKNGRVTYKDCTLAVQIANVLSYNITLTTFEQTQRYMVGNFLVTEYNTTAECKSSTTTPDGFSSLLIPESVSIDVFYPTGFQVSIPAETNATSMTFNGNLSREFKDLGYIHAYVVEGTWFAADAPLQNGTITFTDSRAQFRIGDVIYYQITVSSPSQTKQYEDGVYVVTKYKNIVGSMHPSPVLLPDTTSADCKPSITVLNGVQQRCADRLIFSEHFSDNRIDTSKWTPQERFGGQPDYEFVTYSRRKDVIYVNNGHLSIEPKRLTDFYGDTIFDSNTTLNLQPDCTGERHTIDCFRTNSVDIVPPIVSGQITTKGYFSFLYGFVQIRAKLPDIPWSFLQFFLEPSENAYGHYNFSSGQMRVASVTGVDTCSLSGGVISQGENPLQSEHQCKISCKRKNEQTWSSDYHIYGLKWTPSSITLSVDGEQYCEIGPMKKFYFIGTNGEMIPTIPSIRPTTEMAPFDRLFHLTIGIGIGGHSEFPDVVPNKPWTNLDPRSMRKFWKAVQQTEYPKGKLEVDYIEVFTV